VGRKSVNIIKSIVILILLATGLKNVSASVYPSYGDNSFYNSLVYRSNNTVDNDDELIIRFEKLLRAEKYKESLPLARNVEALLSENKLADIKKIYLTYMLGICYAGNNMNDRAFGSYNLALDLLKQHPIDSIYGKVYYNIGVVHNRTGDYIKSESFFQRSFEIKMKSLRKNDPSLAFEYLIRSIASINLRDYDNAMQLANQGLEIVRTNPDSVPKNVIALLYQTKGTALSNKLDYHQSILNFKKAIAYYDNGLSKDTPYYINMLSNIITSYYFLGQLDQCSYYFEKGENISSQYGTNDMFRLYLNYSSNLAEKDLRKEGFDLLTREFNRIRKAFKPDTRDYNDALQKYAGFLQEYKIDPDKSIDLYLEAYKYVRSHPWDIYMRYEITLGYALAIAQNGKYETALDSVRSILFHQAGEPVPGDYFTNPPDTLLKADKESFDILSAKFSLLRMLSTRDKDTVILINAVKTAELMISVLEKIRINIGEEESRLLLGNKYRDEYLNVIQCLSDCYTLTHNDIYLAKSFEYSEKSKAASLLASMREMKAMEGVLPENLANVERLVEKRIGLYTTLADDERSLESPDYRKLELWNEIILSATNTRDSLKKEFAKNYPDYYSLKYDTRVVGIPDVKELIGKDRNYISYVVSDSMVYIMVINSQFTRIEKVKLDSTFKDVVQRYRRLLSSPDRNGNASNEFNRFQNDGYFLYSILIKPVRPYIISDELILSPDDNLAYFPFETMVTSDEKKSDLHYNTLPYLLREFRISYAYSATLLAESSKTKRTFRNRLIAFAPSYKNPVDINSLWANRQETNGTLPELKYAPEEAGFVAKLTFGKLYTDTAATKSLFTRIAGRFDIIHLAMHTVLNSNDPVNSGMIFSDADSLTDNNLRPYETYAFRLHAKMVVLSSCFTGAGALFAGEGVLSIARGFIFSGSRSVVMSLWEVDDYSGTEIIKSFYRNLKSGRSKSESLRRSRIDYLKNADMLHSHPYFWSTMVIYGDDSPVYISWITRIMFLLIPVLLGLMVYNYFRKR